MAKTKKQAVAAATAAARRSAAVKGGGGSRLDTTVAEAVEGTVDNEGTSSDRARRAARRGKAALEETTQATGEQSGARRGAVETDVIGTESSSADRHLTPAAGGFVSENYYTALEDEVET